MEGEEGFKARLEWFEVPESRLNKGRDEIGYAT